MSNTDDIKIVTHNGTTASVDGDLVDCSSIFYDNLYTISSYSRYPDPPWYKVESIDLYTIKYSADIPGIDPATITINQYDGYIGVRIGELDYWLQSPELNGRKTVIEDVHYKWGQIIFTIKKVPEEGKNIPISIQ